MQQATSSFSQNIRKLFDRNMKFIGSLGHSAAYMQYILAIFEIAFFCDPIIAGKYGSILTKQVFYFLVSPDVKLPFLPIRIGIFCTKECTFVVHQVPSNILANILYGICKFFIMGQLPGIKVGVYQLRLVVKHFLKVGDAPVSIDRISMEATA